MKKSLFCAALMLAFCSCGGSGSSNNKTTNSTMSDEAYKEYKNTLEQVQTAERRLNELEGKEEIMLTADDAIRLNNLANQLYYEFDPMGLDEASLEACKQLQQKSLDLRPRLQTLVNDALSNIETDVLKEDDKLLEKTLSVPVYLKKGDVLRVDAKTDRASILNIFNADAHSTLKNLSGKNQYTCELPIQNSAIYLVELNPGTNAQYTSVHIRYISGSFERLQNPTSVISETVEAQKGDWHVTTINGIAMRKLLEETRKFTLRGQLKAMFSGSSRALVALEVPKGASDVLYSLRVATNETDRSQDGKFYDNMCSSYQRIKLFGLPIYDRQGGSGLISTLLGDNQPLREEDAYINMYVFYDAQQAKKFQDGKPASELKYSVEYSTLGTQSCNGRIPANGHKTIYLAFENERVRYNNYIWLEAVSAVPNTEYFKQKYTVK